MHFNIGVDRFIIHVMNEVASNAYDHSLVRDEFMTRKNNTVSFFKTKMYLKQCLR